MKIFERFLKNLGLLILLAIYTCIGGMIFQALESTAEDERLQTERLNLNSSERILISEIINIVRGGSADFRPDLVRIIKQFEQRSGTKIEQKRWIFKNALFYAGTIYTTIGYGHITCKTLGGQIATIVYAFLGVPLMMYVMVKMCETFYGSLRIAYTYVSEKMHDRLQGHASKYETPKNGRDRIPSETEIPPEHYVPLWVAFVLLVGYVLGAAALLMIWQHEWSYWKACYFVFISVSTIGLGDIIPHDQYLLPTFVIILFGIGMVPIVIAIIHVQINLLVMKIRDKVRAIDVTDGTPLNAGAHADLIRGGVLSSTAKKLARHLIGVTSECSDAFDDVDLNSDKKQKDAMTETTPGLQGVTPMGSTIASISLGLLRVPSYPVSLERLQAGVIRRDRHAQSSPDAPLQRSVRSSSVARCPSTD